MLAVWKFVLAVQQEQGVTMPAGAKLLAVHAQDNWMECPALWALVDPAAPWVHRRVAVWGTGQVIEPTRATGYIGTAWCHGGRLVWHVFDLGERPAG